MKKLMVFLRTFSSKFKIDRIFSQSASLTYVTLLGFIPFLIFLFFLIPELPFIKEKAVENFLISIFVPNSAQQIGDYITELSHRKISFNLFSFLLLIFTSYSLFKIINDTFDKILGETSHEKRNFLNDLMKFFGMCFGGVLLLLILISSSSVPFLLKYIHIPFLKGIITYVSPFLIMFVIFTLGFFFIPTAKVKNTSILIGAGSSALIWIVFKFAFDWYINNLTNIELIFGMVSFIPIYLFWIYFNWIIILSGVILVAILDGRIEPTSLKSNDLPKVRIIIEKETDNSHIDTITQQYIESGNLEELLKNVLDENPDNNNQD
ncbi:MAG: YihY family inner membrane protein [Candidatus Cloacimonetes bacterium]|nr:YihY family inner membrane protein [Candidatus Cloacimonadota bacterium]